MVIFVSQCMMRVFKMLKDMTLKVKLEDEIFELEYLSNRLQSEINNLKDEYISKSREFNKVSDQLRDLRWKFKGLLNKSTD